jgi:hypothetical protein
MRRQTIGFTFTLIFAILSGFLVIGEEFEKVERAHYEAENAIDSISGSAGYYFGTAASIEDAFANTLWGGSEAAEKYARVATEHANIDYYYRVRGEGVTQAGIGMTAIPAEKINPATREGVMAHFEETAMMFLENKPHDSQQPFIMLLAVFLLKLLGAVGPSLIPYLLSILAEPLWVTGMTAVVMLAAVVLVRPADAQTNLLKANVSVQGSERSITPALFRFYDSANAYASVTPSTASIGGGPSWSVSDTLKWAGRKLSLSIHNPVGLDHDGEHLASVKLWNVMTGKVGRLSFYSKSFLSFPVWQTKPNLGLSANHVVYDLTDKLSLGWRTKNVLVKTPTKWVNNWRMGPVGNIKLSDTVSGLLHFAQIGNSQSIRLELSVVF